MTFTLVIGAGYTVAILRLHVSFLCLLGCPSSRSRFRQLLHVLEDRAKGLLKSPYHVLELLLVFCGDEIVLAEVFVAGASRMALIEGEYLVD